MVGKVIFVGAGGPGDPELITVKGMKYLQQADVIIYAGSLVNPEILKWARPNAEIHNSASMTLEEIVDIMVRRAREDKLVVRLKSGDASIYGALLEEVIALREAGIPYEVVPGVTAALAAAAVLGIELTLPKVAQTVIITRASARVPMRGSIRDFAGALLIGATMAIYTGVHLIDKVVKELREAGVPDDTPVTVVYKATWPDQMIIRGGTLSDIAEKVKRAKITKDSVIIVGKAADPSILDTPVRSSVYDPRHTHSFRPKPKIGNMDAE